MTDEEDRHRGEHYGSDATGSTSTVLSTGVDDDLVERLAKNLDDSFEELVLTAQHFVYSVAFRLTLDRHEAEDVTQETLVRAYRALAGYDAERIRATRLRPWLAKIALNVQRNRARRRKDAVAGVPEAATRPADGPEAMAEASDARASCAAHVASLPEAYRVVVTLRHIEGLSYAEVAAALDKPVGTVKAQVHRAIALLRERMDEEDRRWKARA